MFVLVFIVPQVPPTCCKRQTFEEGLNSVMSCVQRGDAKLIYRVSYASYVVFHLIFLMNLKGLKTKDV